MTDQDHAAELAVTELAKRLRAVIPAGLLVDADAFAARFITDLQAEHWRCLPPPPEWRHDPPDPEATARGVAMARAALERTDP